MINTDNNLSAFVPRLLTLGIKYGKIPVFRLLPSIETFCGQFVQGVKISSQSNQLHRLILLLKTKNLSQYFQLLLCCIKSSLLTKNKLSRLSSSEPIGRVDME